MSSCPFFSCLCNIKKIVGCSIIIVGLRFHGCTDLNDFDGSSVEVTFPADENTAVIINVPAPIPFHDDEVNEASIQYFIVYMEVIEATDINLISTTSRNFSVCQIFDNDGVL